MWKGVVSFGLVTIPVKLYSATEEHDVPLHQVHAKDAGRVRYRRICEAEGVEVPYAEIARGYQLPDGETVVLTEEDLASLPIASSRTIDVLRFVPDEEISPLYLSRSYYLEADGPGAKPYVLLREALSQAGTSALVKVALRQRESLALLRAHDEVLVLQTMLWPDEIRDPSTIAPPDDIEVRQQELKMAESYIDTLTGDFNPDEFHDDYAEALRAVVEAKTAGHELKKPETAAPRGAEVIDLMAALEASVAEAKKSRTGGSAESAAAKKAAAKAPAKAPAASKAPAKKATKSTTSQTAAAEKKAAKSTAKRDATKTSAEKKAAPRKKASPRKTA